jgi:hypothetical protein
MNTESIKLFLSTTAIDVGIKILAALAFWFVGRWLIGRVIALIRVALGRSNVDPTLTKYLGSIVAVALNIALVLGILGYFGIETTSFAAMLAGAVIAMAPPGADARQFRRRGVHAGAPSFQGWRLRLDRRNLGHGSRADSSARRLSLLTTS